MTKVWILFVIIIYINKSKELRFTMYTIHPLCGLTATQLRAFGKDAHKEKYIFTAFLMLMRIFVHD